MNILRLSLFGVVLVLLGVFVGLVLPFDVDIGRTNVKQLKFTRENRDEVMEAVSKRKDLKGEEVGLLLAATVREAISGDVIEGKTVGQIIEEQREFNRNAEARAREEKRLAEARAQEERILAEEAKRREEALAAEIRNHLSVSVFDKGFTEKDIYASRFNEYITFKVAMHNTGGKAIRAFRGTIVFKDLFGKKIYTISLYYDEGLRPNQKKNETYTIEYNQFRDEQEKLRFTALSNMRVEWKPQSILFTDGTKLGE